MTKKNETIVIIAAGGQGRRLGSEKPKQFLEVDGIPMICKSVKPFIDTERVDALYIVVPEGYEEYCEALFKKHFEGNKFKKIRSIISGGAERQDSIYEAIKLISKAKNCNCEDNSIILIHDGARPFVTSNIIERVIDGTKKYGAVIPIIPLIDTVRMKNGENIDVIDRDKLMIAQTPQGFKYDILIESYEKAMKATYYGTDDAQLLQWAGVPLETVEGEVLNKKITTKEDLQQTPHTQTLPIPRVGTGYDVHRLTEGYKLILGGVDIPFEKGLEGHSDADVLVHTIMDSLLGAAGLGDIGVHFPPTDEQYKGISSLELLRRVKILLNENSYEIGNIDATVICEKPKIKEYVPKMKKNICEVLQIAEGQLNIKGTTTEKLGFEGKGEGIASLASALIVAKSK